RIAGDGVETGTYTPSDTEARAGVVNVAGNTFTFTGVEPLVFHGLASFNVNMPVTAPADLAVDSLHVADLNLTNLVLHTVTVDGVVSWTESRTLSLANSAPDTKHAGQASAISGDTLV